MKKIHFNVIDSTNTYLEKNFRKLPNPCAVYADIQTVGKGRLNRRWDSGAGGLWFSVLFKNPLLPPPVLQRICSIVSVEILMELTDEKGFGLKWPNDIYFKDKKISGCLQKNIFSGSETACIVGTGININNTIPEELTDKGISLKMITGKEYDCSEILNIILINIERELKDFDEKNLISRYRGYSIIKPGSKVSVRRFEDEMVLVGEVLEHPMDDIKIRIGNEIFIYKSGDITLKEW